MDRSDQVNVEVSQLFDRWLSRTEDIMRSRISEMGIGSYRGKRGPDELLRSLSTQMRSLGQGYLEGSITFLERGRFVDMGSGRGYSFGQSIRGSHDLETGRSKRKGRRPKKWYGKVFYGRLNDLQGAVGYTMMEGVMSTLKKELQST
jgi:hypothetical protein